MTQSSKQVKDNWKLRNKHNIPAISRASRLRRVFGITTEKYRSLYEKQNGECAICHTPFVGIKEEPKHARPHVDHDHSTNWVRGVLCGLCNSGIGFLGDNIASLQAAIEYLKENPTPKGFVFSPIPNPPRKTNSGVERDQEWRRRNAEARLGQEPWNKGKPWSEEAKAKMSKSALNRWKKDT
jgi:hypothetical protein